MKLRSRDFGDLQPAQERLADGHPSMKLRSRDFGDVVRDISGAHEPPDPSMKLRSRDFGDGAVDDAACDLFEPSMKLRSRDFGDWEKGTLERWQKGPQ